MLGKRLGFAGLLMFLAAAGAAFGSGYSVYEQGAKAMGNAGAFTARADDPSALFFNPAGILQLPGIQVSLGTTAVFLTGSEFHSSLTGDTFHQDDNMAWPANLYYTQKLGDDWAWGFGITSPFGLKTQWGPTFEGRYISRESNIAVVNLNPNVARRIGRSWTVAAGIDYAKADVRELSHNINLGFPVVPDGFVKLTGDGTDLGWNIAARWASEKGWRWGGSYRSEMKPDIEGHVTFEVPAIAAPAFPNGPATSSLPLPASFATGVAYLAPGKWEGEFDVVWTRWSAFDRLRIDVQNEPVAPLDVDQIEDWKDTYSFRAGALYRLNQAHQIRLGFYFDQNPVPGEHVRPRLPDADRSSAQVGYGFAGKSGFTFDFAYQALFFADRTATGDPASATDPVQPGVYKNFTSLVGVNFGWRFGK
jgi:long-chain fatty acid transport protein